MLVKSIEVFKKIEIISQMIPKNKKIAVILNNDEFFLPAFLAILNRRCKGIYFYPEGNANEQNRLIKDLKLSYLLTTRKNGLNIKIKHLIIIDKCKRSNKRYNENSSKDKFDDLVLYSPTSGTSGRNKWVGITNKNIIWVSKQYKKLYDLKKRKKILVVLPLFHNYGMFANLTSSFITYMFID